MYISEFISGVNGARGFAAGHGRCSLQERKEGGRRRTYTPPPAVVALIFRHYNDVDHMVPIAQVLLDEGFLVRAVVTSSIDFVKDPRTQCLQEAENFSIHEVGWLSLQWSRAVWNRYVSDSFLDQIRLRLVPIPRLLRTTSGNPIAALIHDFGGTERWGFHAARSKGIPNICVPHGYNIFKNFDVTRQIRQKGGWHSYANRSAFDAYVTNSKRHRSQLITQGLDFSVCIALGSTRFDRQYSAINLARMPAFDWPDGVRDGSSLRVVYFEPHKDYNVNHFEHIEMLQAMCGIHRVSVVIKAHTRSGSSISARDRVALESHGAVFAERGAESPAIVRSADVVVCFGSSIGIEALLQRKPLINPSFAHSNSSIFDDPAIAMQARTLPQLVALLNKVAVSASREEFLPSEAELDRFLSAEVLGGERSAEEASVARQYLALILKFAIQRP